MKIKYFLLALVVASGIVDAAEYKKAGKQHATTHKTVVKKAKQKTKLAKASVPEVVEVAEPVIVEVTAEPVHTVTKTTVTYADTGMRSHSYSDKDVHCLAKNIYYEAGSEPRKGKIAVAQVTLNRVNSGKFANSICGVVYEKNQFSWVNQITRSKIIPFNSRWEECMDVAEAVLSGEELIPSMSNALYFHNTSVKIAFGKPLGRIGNHIFYGDRVRRNDNI